MLKKNLKLRVLAALMALALCATFTACGNSSDNDVVIGGNVSDDTNQNTTESLAFVYNNVKVTPNDLVEPLIPALGSDYKYSESPSCAYIGLDKVYVYSDFILYTYPDDKAVDHVLQIVLTSENLSTAEGLKLGDPASKITEIYGDNYKESSGSYAYTFGKTTLVILTKDNIIQSIQYNYTDAL